MKSVESMTDAELAKHEAELRDERARRSQERKAAQQAEWARRLLFLGENDNKALNVLVPTHTPGRYGDTCNDNNTARGLGPPIDGKDWYCTRCLLLDMIEAARRDDLAALASFDIQIGGYNHK